MAKPSIPQGTRDFSATTMRKRQFIFQTIQLVFENFGFQPLETPALENLDTLMGKYGEEGDKLIFKILNNGLDHPAKEANARADFEKILAGKNSNGITERALRYDLTIPFARYVAMNYGQLTLPFKRYQIQPVWRADRPQKGRYREFYQCDADVVGSKSLLNEVELASIYSKVFEKLQLPVSIRINSRKILAALAEVCDAAEQFTTITVAIDKLSKIGLEKVKEELSLKGLQAAQIALIENYLTIDGDNATKLNKLSLLLGENALGKEGIEELQYLLHFHEQNQAILCDFTLARGLNYYTGIIFEVTANEVNIGSIGGGGRYDDLTGLFGLPNVSGVGISFGLDRIYDVLEELNRFPSELQSSTKVLFFHLGNAVLKPSFQLLQQLRDAGIAAEIFHEPSKFDKQFKYAEKKQIPFVVILGEEELANKQVIVKNLNTGLQTTIAQDQLLAYFQ